MSMPEPMPYEHLGIYMYYIHTAAHTRSHLHWHTHADPVVELLTRVRVGEAMAMGAASLHGGPCHLFTLQEKHICTCLLRNNHVTGILPATLRNDQSYPRNPHTVSWRRGSILNIWLLLPSCPSYPQFPRVSSGLSAGKGFRAIGHEQGWCLVQLIERSSE